MKSAALRGAIQFVQVPGANLEIMRTTRTWRAQVADDEAQ